MHYTFLNFNLYFISELMDALSDPRAFMSAQEKREQQMKAMGIEAADINTKDIKIVGKGSNKATGSGCGPGKERQEEKGDWDFLSIENLYGPLRLNCSFVNSPPGGRGWIIGVRLC